MFLAVDVGNSNVVVGVHHQEKWIEVWRLETDTEKRAPDYEPILTLNGLRIIAERHRTA